MFKTSNERHILGAISDLDRHNHKNCNQFGFNSTQIISVY